MERGAVKTPGSIASNGCVFRWFSDVQNPKNICQEMINKMVFLGLRLSKAGSIIWTPPPPKGGRWQKNPDGATASEVKWVTWQAFDPRVVGSLGVFPTTSVILLESPFICTK